MSLFLKKALFLFLSLFLIISLNAQDFSKAKVDDLSDGQILEFIQKYESKNLTLEQAENVALQNGMSASEWAKLKSRVLALKSTSVAHQDVNGEILERTIDPGSVISQNIPVKNNIYGSALFNKAALTFEPNLQLPTPENYQLGPGDDLVVDVYGLSENAYRLTVSPEGFIRIPRVGLVQVSGLTIEQARKTIAKQLSIIYTTIQTHETFVSVTLGNIRSIKVLIIGEAYRPGTYTLPSVASVFNALNASGGPNENGSFRNIKLVRSGKEIAQIDIYDFLLTGELKNNLCLRDQDIIRIDPYCKRVSLEGEVKNTGLFEAKENETLSNLITYAGGFSDKAYVDRITVFRNTSKERSVADVSNSQFANFVMDNGDHFIVGKILDRYSNRIQIGGAVYRPGIYALEEGMTVKQLINKADGVTEDAFLNRAVLTREREDKSKEIISFDLGKLLRGEIQDIPIKREDALHIATILEMQDFQSVSIWGEVQREGTYAYNHNMTLADLVFIAGGLKDKAELREVEVSRMIKDPNILKDSVRRTQTFVFSLDKDLNLKTGGFALEPLDQVVIRPISGYEGMKRVSIAGEIYYPGSYIVSSKNERISDLVKKAGGLNQFAFPEGASLWRNQKANYAEKKLDASVFSDVSQGDMLVDKRDFLTNEGIVGIDLVQIMKNPHSKWDLILEEGDILNIPKQMQTVQVSGEVFLPTFVRYDKSMSFSDYIDNAGGFASKALKRKSFVVYANGSAKSTKSFLFFKKYPSIKPGAHIYVPTKPEHKGMTTAETMSIATSTTSMAALLISLFNTIF